MLIACFSQHNLLLNKELRHCNKKQRIKNKEIQVCITNKPWNRGSVTKEKLDFWVKKDVLAKSLDRRQKTVIMGRKCHCFWHFLIFDPVNGYQKRSESNFLKPPPPCKRREQEERSTSWLTKSARHSTPSRTDRDSEGVHTSVFCLFCGETSSWESSLFGPPLSYENFDSFNRPYYSK